MGPVNDYKICAFTHLNGDLQVLNDTGCSIIHSEPANLDAGISKIIEPIGQTSIGASVQVKVTISNNGKDTLTSVPLDYKINSIVLATETYIGTILPGDSVDYTFNTTFNSAIGSYNLCAETILPGDAYGGNDEKCATLIGTSINDLQGNKFVVLQNNPNPSSDISRIDFFIPRSGNIYFSLINSLGVEVENFQSDFLSGKNSIEINCKKYRAGVYYYIIQFEGISKSYKMIITK